jgi:hypothetical protein
VLIVVSGIERSQLSQLIEVSLFLTRKFIGNFYWGLYQTPPLRIKPVIGVTCFLCCLLLLTFDFKHVTLRTIALTLNCTSVFCKLPQITGTLDLESSCLIVKFCWEYLLYCKGEVLVASIVNQRPIYCQL